MQLRTQAAALGIYHDDKEKGYPNRRVYRELSDELARRARGLPLT